MPRLISPHFASLVCVAALLAGCVDDSSGGLEPAADVAASEPTPDATPGGADIGALDALAEPDASPSEPDAAPEPDAELDPDAAPPEPDAEPLEPDAAADLDAAPPEPDAAPPEPDAAPPEPDAAPPEPDAEPPEPDAELPRGDARPGDACDADQACAAGRCLPDPGFPDGYCAEVNCNAGDPCERGTTCVGGPGGTICAASCEDGCREGYGCVEVAGALVCLPGEDGDRSDGMPCERDDQCAGGSCIVQWPGGYCTTVACADRDDCARGRGDAVDNRCYLNPDPNICVRICEAQADCRPGYICEVLGGGVGACLPRPQLEPDEIEDSPLNIVCQPAPRDTVYTLNYSIDEDTTAYMVVPFTIDGEGVNPVRIERPGGERINLRDENDFQRTPARLWSTLNPTVVPATPQFAAQLEPGEHRYLIESDAEQLCWYHLEESAPGTTIDLNIYLVGLELAAADAPDDPDLQETLAHVEFVFEAAGVALGTVRYIDVGGWLGQVYGVLRGQDEMGELLALTEPPGPTRDDALSLNVLFIQTFAFPGQGDRRPLGISNGLPGPAGLHGMPNSGVVFTAEFLGTESEDGQNGNIFTGGVLAHEIGHYIGLFHTTEQDGRTTDPLPDTPSCTNGGGPTRNPNCPDRTNLMFPFAQFDNSVVTPDQVHVIRVNPLTKD